MPSMRLDGLFVIFCGAANMIHIPLVFLRHPWVDAHAYTGEHTLYICVHIIYFMRSKTHRSYSFISDLI